MYNTLLLLHILGAIAWIGGGFAAWMGTRLVLRTEGQGAAIDEFLSNEWMGKYVFGPAPIVVLVTGIGMVVTEVAWSFSQVWVYMTLGLFVVVGALGGGASTKIERNIKSSHEAGTSESAETGAQLSRYVRLVGIELGLLVAIEALMVFKPGI